MKFLTAISFLSVSFLWASGEQEDLSPGQLQKRINELTPRLVAATVGIKVGMGSGSGVIVSPEGLVLTAAHVINKSGNKLIFLLSDGRELPGTSLGVDHGTDAGLARIDSPGPFPYQPYIEEKTYDTGDWALALGHPGGPHIGRPSPVRLGRINRAGEESGFADPISTTAFVISGDSGGPLFDLEGRVIGINSNISGNWDTNNHVPLPAFIKVWNELNASQTISGEDREKKDPGFDDPFRFQRDYFFEELTKRPDDPAAHLLERPRLLDPHRIQEHLDRWAREAEHSAPFDPNNYHTGIPPEPQQAPAPHLGITLDRKLDSARIINIDPDAPAAHAGLSIGDRIVTLEQDNITGVRSFSHRLSEQVFDPDNPTAIRLGIITADGESKSLEIFPELVPARRYFRQPLSVLSDMMLSNAAAIPLSEQLRQRRATFLAGLPEPDLSVLAITRDGRPVTLATAVSVEGELLTKASEITDRDGDLLDGLAIEHGGEQREIRLIGSDFANDLALVKMDTDGLVPVHWNGSSSPTTGTLVFAPMPVGSPITGIVTQPIRPAPKVGFDHLLVLGETPPFLGVSLSAPLDRKHPVVELIEPDSPAELAGFLEGDIILKIGDEDIRDEKSLLNKIRDYQPGEKLTVNVERGERKIGLNPILGTRSTNRNIHSPMATRVDQSLLQLSARGGTLNRRRQGFPNAIYHDTKLEAGICGGPLLNMEGKVIGINISRSLRHRTLAIPAAGVIEVLNQLRR